MVIRSSSSPDFQFAKIKPGQRWLPLVALLLLALEASAAVDTEVRQQVSRLQAQLGQLQRQVSVMFRSRKLKISVAIIGRKVKTTKPNSQGARKSNPVFISLRLIGDILRIVESETFSRFWVSSSSMAYSF